MVKIEITGDTPRDIVMVLSALKLKKLPMEWGKEKAEDDSSRSEEPKESQVESCVVINNSQDGPFLY